jgi:hypothetical protein
MGMFDKLKKQFTKKKPVVVEKPKKAPEKTAKEIATEKGEPYVAILTMDVDPNNITQGAFELDWNDIFVARLVKAGYMMNPKDVDSDIVDRWFTTVCRNVALETYEQYEAMNPERDRVIKTRNIGDGRSEVS